jgi:hypothetical protein
MKDVLVSYRDGRGNEQTILLPCSDPTNLEKLTWIITRLRSQHTPILIHKVTEV